MIFMFYKLLLIWLLVALAYTDYCDHQPKTAQCYSCREQIKHCQICTSSRDVCLQCEESYSYNKKSNKCQTSPLIIFTLLLVIFMGVVPALILLSLLIYWCVQRRRRILAERAAEQAIRMEYQANQQQMDVFTNSVMIFDKEKDICAICLEGQTNVVTKCNHYFHFDCLKLWTAKAPDCPNCKATCRIMKSRCPNCKNFTKTFVICPGDCQHSNHYECIGPALQGECGYCRLQEERDETKIETQKHIITI